MNNIFFDDISKLGDYVIIENNYLIGYFGYMDEKIFMECKNVLLNHIEQIHFQKNNNLSKIRMELSKILKRNIFFEIDGHDDINYKLVKIDLPNINNLSVVTTAAMTTITTMSANITDDSYSYSDASWPFSEISTPCSSPLEKTINFGDSFSTNFYDDDNLQKTILKAIQEYIYFLIESFYAILKTNVLQKTNFIMYLFKWSYDEQHNIITTFLLPIFCMNTFEKTNNDEYITIIELLHNIKIQLNNTNKRLLKLEQHIYEKKKNNSDYYSCISE